MKAAQAKPLVRNAAPVWAKLFAAEGFAEEVRRDLVELYGKEALGKGGYSVRTTLDPKLQIFARQSLARGLIELTANAASVVLSNMWTLKVATGASTSKACACRTTSRLGALLS